MGAFSQRFGTVVELFRYVASHKRWWLIPLLVIVLLVGMLVIFAQLTGVSRFVYPSF